MAQIIKHRRGTAAQLKTTLLQKAEIGVSTGSVAGITTPVLHIGDGVNQAGFVVGRLFQGSTVPTLNSGAIGTSLNDMLFHDSATYKLIKLNSGGNENLDLTGNIADRVISGSLTVGTAAENNDLLHVHGDISASGNIHAVGNITFEGGSSGTIQLGSGADDNVVISGDVNSNIIPNTDNTFDLGSSGQQWKDLYINGIGYIDQLGTDADPSTAYIGGGEIDGTVIGGESAAAGAFTTLSSTGATALGNSVDDTITATGIITLSGPVTASTHVSASGDLSVTGNVDFDGNVDIDNTTTTIDSSGGISLDGGAASNLTTSAGALTLSGAGGVNIAGSNQEIDITTTGAVDINSAAFTLNGSTVGIDGSSTLTLGGSAIDIDADGGVVSIDGSSGVNIGTAADTAIDIDSTTLDIDSTGAITIDAGNSSGISIDAAAASNFSTSGGGLTLEGAAGVTVTSTGGTLLLNGTGQTVDINAATLDLDATNVNIDATSGISLDAAAASNFTTTDGAITINGKTGVAIQENGTDVIAIDTNQDVLFSRTGGSTSDPDVEFDGYVRFDGITEVANTTSATSTGTGALIVDGGVGIAENLHVGGNTVVTGDLTVVGTNTYVSSSVVSLGDSIVTLNALNNAVDGGIQVIDVSGSSTGSGLSSANPTGSLLWNAANDYWYSGVSGSTHYRLPQQATNAALTENKVLIADANGRVEPSANITDNGSTIDFNDVDLTSIDKLEGVDANTFIDIGASDTITTKGNIVPSANNADDLGTDANRFKDGYLDGNLDVDGNLDIDGTTNLDAVDIDGAVQIDATVTVGVDDTGYDVKFFGATSGQYLLWDESADELVLAGDSKISFHDAAGGENIVATSDGHLEINAGTTLDLTAPTIDLNVSSELNIDGNTDLNGTLDVSGITDFQSKVHAQAGLEVTGSVFVSAGASVEATGSGVGSRVAFRNESNTQIGYLSSDMGSDVTNGLIGYNDSHQLVVSNVIDGGSF